MEEPQSHPFSQILDHSAFLDLNVCQEAVVPLIITPGVESKIEEALYFHPVRSLEDVALIENGDTSRMQTFHPLFAHHFFTEKKIPFKKLCINIYYAVDSLAVYIDLHGSESTNEIAENNGRDSGRDSGKESGKESERDSGRDSGSDSERNNAGESGSDSGRDDVRTSERDSRSDSGSDSGKDNKDQSEYDAITDPGLAWVLAQLKHVPYPGEIFTDLDKFKLALAWGKSTESPFGSSVLRWKLPSGKQKKGITIDIRAAKFAIAIGANEPPVRTIRDDQFQEFHLRLEWLLHFFIESCSSIIPDHHWTILLIYARYDVDGGDVDAVKPDENSDERSEKYLAGVKDRIVAAHDVKRRKLNSLSGKIGALYELAGAVTLYHFFALPKCRRRLSQFLVLQPFQRRGIAQTVLGYVFNQAILDPLYQEITIEDPAPDFAKVRLVVELLLAISHNVIPPEALFPTGCKIQSKIPIVQQLRTHFGLPATSETDAIISVQELCRVQDPADLLSLELLQTEIRSRLKTTVIEARKLAEAIACARLLPEPIPSDVFRHKSSKNGASREDLHDDSDKATDFWNGDKFSSLRIRIKRRIRTENMEELFTMSHKKLCDYLRNAWFKTFADYCTVVKSVRKSITS